MWKSQRKNRFVGLGAFEDQRSGVLFRGSGRNRQSESGTSDVSRILSTIKSIENMRALVVTDPRAAVVHAHDDVAMLVFHRHDYGLPGAVFDRILDEIDDRLMNFGRVGKDLRRLRTVDRDLSAAGVAHLLDG